jgi:dihydrodipicolinate synthase/N-acetylneuraminate lyase
MTTEPSHPAANQSWRGVFSILCTPFDTDGNIDWASLRSEIAFCLDAGAHGIVCNVNASESWTLTDDERRQVAHTVVKEVAGRVPTIVGISGGSLAISLLHGTHAADIGADAVMAMPPPSRMTASVNAYEFYRRLGEIVPLPVFLQNHDAPLGTRLAPELVARIVNDLPNIDWIKEETIPAGHAISRELELCTGKLRGIMGGLAGRYLLDEHRRGAAGTMPACESTDVHVKLWNLLDEGRTEEARRVFERLLPLLNYEATSSGVYKTVLHWRGVIKTDFLRSAEGNPLDGGDREELARIVNAMRDLFSVYPPSAGQQSGR